MFVYFEILIEDGPNRERISLVVSSPKEAVTLFCLWETTPRVIAWKCLTHKPEELGCASGDSPLWRKYRSNEKGFTFEDYGVDEKRLWSRCL